MAIGRKLSEMLKLVQFQTGSSQQIAAFLPERIQGATVRYNGTDYKSGAGYMLDTKDYDRVTFVAMFGTGLGAACTLSVDIYENSTDTMVGSTLVTGASFTDVYTSNDECVEIGEVDCSKSKRYLAVRAETTGALSTFDFAGLAIMGQGRSEPVTQTVKFDV